MGWIVPYPFPVPVLGFDSVAKAADLDSDGSGEQDPSSLVLEYVGYWNRDFALFLERAEIRAYEDGRRVGTTEFSAPNSLNLSKFGEEPERIRIMMDVLSTRVSCSEPKRTRALGETRI